MAVGTGPGGPSILAVGGDDLLAGRENQSRIPSRTIDGDSQTDVAVAPGTGTAGLVVAYLDQDISPDSLPPEFDGLGDLPGMIGGACVG